ncbi:HNH endonuclease [Nitratireductor aquimarinus]|uniref:HNH endonuclease n=1 Tax=Alphaproteobacteria TaxID=28211 RepID=UPI0019D35C9A|nr:MULTISPECIES: HNH endonuclease [Alphaproteobacteria]MBN7758946.1 HNH endonuclease [Nitratireductor aquimarinus]MBY6001619.1 HNH endonuclease [Tritonibacter mobilis]MBY6023907.1 HNH endonuclease [Nitratireductor sp. DP7N14-4]
MSDIQPTTFKLRAFAEWIEAQGGSVDAPTSEWEVLRYRLTGKSPLIIYRNKKGKLTVSDETRADYRQFLDETGAGGEQAIQKMRRQNGAALRNSIIDRLERETGYACCCYCGQFVTRESSTLEHFVPISKGGPNHEFNLGIACEPCNLAVGSKPVVEKLVVRDQIRAAVQDIAPWDDFDARTIMGAAA